MRETDDRGTDFRFPCEYLGRLVTRESNTKPMTAAASSNKVERMHESSLEQAIRYQQTGFDRREMIEE